MGKKDDTRDIGVKPEKEIHLTPSDDETGSGRIIDALEEPAEEEDVSSSE